MFGSTKNGEGCGIFRNRLAVHSACSDRDVSFLVLDVFQILGAHFDCCILIDHFKGEHESQAISLPDQDPLQTLHGTALDADFPADNEFPVRLHVPVLDARAQQVNS